MPTNRRIEKEDNIALQAVNEKLGTKLMRTSMERRSMPRMEPPRAPPPRTKRKTDEKVKEVEARGKERSKESRTRQDDHGITLTAGEVERQVILRRDLVAELEVSFPLQNYTEIIPVPEEPVTDYSRRTH